MRLQIKKLEGPDEIRLATGTDTTYTGTVTTNRANRKFTCYLNRAVRDTDIFPIFVTVKIYNDEGTEHCTFSLSVDRNNINNPNQDTANFCFIITLNCPQTLSGSYFHIHTILVNADTNAQNISYTISSYHETIKKVYIYSSKQFEQVYWSSAEQITYEEESATQESLRTGGIGQNEDAFLHIKTLGMYKDRIAVILTADNDSIILNGIPTRMKQNRGVIAFDMSEVIQRYRQRTGKHTGNVTFTLKAWIAVRNSDNKFTLVSSPTNPLLIQLEAARILPARGIERFTPLIMEPTDQLTVSCTDSDPAVKRSSTGTVYVRATTAQVEEVTPTKFTDFRIGRITHLEGVGSIANKYNNTSSNVRLTVYPIRVYDIMLSDLIVSGIITLEDAIVIGPPPATQTDEARQRKRTTLEGAFNKVTQAITNDATGNSRVLLDLFGQTEAFGRNNIYKLNETGKVRKILAIARTRTAVFERTVCRDAWQGDRGRDRDGRYNYAKECPPGEYFINYKNGGKYRVIVSQYASEAYIANQIDAIACISDYPTEAGHLQPRRGSIALHKGGAQVSIGCITFNLEFNKNKDNNFDDFTKIMYKITNNKKYLNFICIDERNALQNSDPDHRYYDLVKPPRTAKGTNHSSEYLTI